MPSQPPDSEGPDPRRDPSTEEIPRFGAPDPSQMARFGERPRYAEDPVETPLLSPPDDTPDEAAEGPYPYGFSETRPKGRSARTGSSAASAPGPGLDAPQRTAAAPGAAPSASVPRRGRRIVVVLGLLAVVLAAVAVLWGVGRVIYGPDDEVEELMGAVRDGQASDVEELMNPNVPREQRLLLQDPVYLVSGHPVEDVEITRVDRDGDDATVTASVTQNAVTTPVVFLLTRSGREDVVFPGWDVEEASPSLYQSLSVKVPEDARTLSINGRQVEIPAHSGDTLELAALPGDYSFGAGAGEVTAEVRLADAAAGPEAVEVPRAG